MNKFLRPLLLVLFLFACAPQIATPDPNLYVDPLGRNTWNFIVLGSDYREGDPERQNAHTDAFVIVHVVESNGVTDVTFLPISRELYVPVENSPDVRLSSIYNRVGFEGLTYWTEQVFGLKINAVLYTDLDKFVSFIDGIGGVKLTVTKAVKDQCGDKTYNLKQGQTEVFSGADLLCYARMRKGSENGYFDRQVRHADILAALWAKLEDQVGLDSGVLVENAMSNQFVEVWPYVEWVDLGNLAIRASLNDVDYRTVSLDEGFLDLDMLDGAYIYHPRLDLRVWVECALDRNCDVSQLPLAPIVVNNFATPEE